MNYIIKMAFKNLFRHKLRTLVSIIGIAISVAVVVFTRGLMLGFTEDTFSDYVQYKTGHIRVVNQEYEQKERLLSLNYPVENVSGLISDMKEVEGVEMVVPRIRFGAMVSRDEELVKMIGWGVDPEKETNFTRIEEQLVEGRMVQSGKMEVTMGTKLLEKLDARVGDKVTILYTTSFNSFKGATFKVVGQIESSLGLLNNTVFYLPLDKAQQLLLMENLATELLVVTPDLDRADEVKPRLASFMESKGVSDKYSLKVWDEGGSMVEMLKIGARVYDVIYVLLVVLASFVVINAMIMVVKERTKEIGMMSALGLESSQILTLFITEGTIMGIVGSFIGAVTGGIITKVVSITGIDYTEAFQAVGEDLLVRPILRPVFTVDVMFFAFALGIIITAIACIIPARKAARLEPTEALRN